MCCAALLELRQNREAKRLRQENEKNVARNECKQAAGDGEIVQPVSASVEEPRDDVSVNIDENARGGGEMRGVQSETGETSSMLEIAASPDTDTPSRLDLGEQKDKLVDSANTAEQHEPETTTAGQSACIKLPPSADGDDLEPTDGQLNEVDVDDIDVIDLTAQCTSISISQHLTTVFPEVSVLHRAKQENISAS